VLGPATPATLRLTAHSNAHGRRRRDETQISQIATGLFGA
jgi:hypothetical protein